MRFCLLLLCLFAGCIDITNPTPVSNGTAASNTNTNTNTNTVTVTVDRSDTDPAPTSPPAAPGDPAGPSGVLPLPTYGEGVTRDYAAANPYQVTHSCQTTDGAGAWAFLDGLIALLRQRDARWGYLCKDASCSKVAADVVAYRASAGDTGIWIVDVLGNHCPGPQDSPTQVRWGPLPFETVRRWSGTR